MPVWLTGLVLALLAALLAGAGCVWWVLESSGVTVIETRRPDGTPRNTHVWFADVEGLMWLEAATPDQKWYRDVQRDSRVVLRQDGYERPYVALPFPGPQAQRYVRSLLREKYGLRDRVLGWAVDTSKSVAVRLSPVPEKEGH